MPTYFRWIARGPELDAAKTGKMQYSSDKAFWVFAMGASYRPGGGITADRVLVAFEIDDTSQGYIDGATHMSASESADFKGEAAHPDDVLTKENEPGALGLGKNLYKRINTRGTTKARLA